MNAQGNTTEAREAAAETAALQREELKEEALVTAHGRPLPGALLEAFLPQECQAAGLALRPVVASDGAILQRINSPLLAQLAELWKPAGERQEIEISDEDVWELVFLWTRPIHEVRAALRKAQQGTKTEWREYFRELALGATVDRLPISFLTKENAEGLAKGVMGHFFRAFGTSLEYEPKKGTKAEESGQVFTAPPAGA